jgi:transposase
MSERHSMRQIREVLRLKFEAGCSHRKISAAVGLSKGSISDYLQRAEAAGLSWANASELDDAELERRLFRAVGRNGPPSRAPIDFAWVQREMPKTGVTLQQLWLEYQEAVKKADSGARAYQYSQFCDQWAVYRQRLDVTMRQVHRAGEKAFVDYSGKKPHIVDSKTGEVADVELFVMVLGASNYTYAEATYTQGLKDFVASTVRALEFYDSVPAVVVPDQLKSAVKKSDRYTPEINETYAELARHYGVAIIPARPKKPRDKAKVEVGVQVAQRWILACLRNRTFFSLDALNEAIWELLEKLNRRPFQKLDGCRRSLFESIDRPAMKALPLMRYVLAEWKKATANIDYHVDYDFRLYSVHHTLAGFAVEVRATSTMVEIFHNHVRVVAHRRCYGPRGTATTLEAHRPKSHRDYGAWPPSRLISWAGTIGASTSEVVEHILKSKPHPEQGYRSCLALIRAAKKYGHDRTEAACRRALAIGSPTRKSVEAILARGLEQAPSEEPEAQPSLFEHANIRGGRYFDRETPPEADLDSPGGTPALDQVEIVDPEPS